MDALSPTISNIEVDRIGSHIEVVGRIEVVWTRMKCLGVTRSHIVVASAVALAIAVTFVALAIAVTFVAALVALMH